MTTKVNFNIIETDWTAKFNRMYSQIKQDYANGMKVMDIKSKHGLSDGRWIAFRKQLLADGVIVDEKHKTKPKYYSAYRGGFVVQKVVDKKKYHIGAFRTEAEAKLCVQLMEECNWDLTQKNEIVNRIRSETNAKK